MVVVDERISKREALFLYAVYVLFVLSQVGVSIFIF